MRRKDFPVVKRRRRRRGANGKGVQRDMAGPTMWKAKDSTRGGDKAVAKKLLFEKIQKGMCERGIKLYKKLYIK